MVFLCSCGGLIWENKVHVCARSRCSCGWLKYEGRGHCCGYIPDYSKPPTDWELYSGYRCVDEWMGSSTWGKRSPRLFETKYEETRVLNTALSMKDIKNLKQTGSFQDYCSSFDFLLTKVIVSEDYATSLFVEGLKHEIKWWVQFFRPKTLEEAYERAKKQDNFLTICYGNKEFKKVGSQSFSANGDEECSEMEVQLIDETEKGVEAQETIDQVLIHDSREDGKEGKANLVDEMLEEKVNSTKGYFEESVKEKHDGNIESENGISANALNEMMVEDSKKNKTNVEANKDEKLECSDNLEVLSLVDSGDAFMIDMGHKWMGLITVYHLIAIYNCKVVHKCKKFRLSSFPTVYEHANEIYCVKTFELKANPYDSGRNGEDTVGAPYKFMFRVQVTLGRLPMLNVKMVDIVSEHTVVITEDSVPTDLVNVIKTLDKIGSCKGIKKIYKMDCTIKQELLIRRMNWWHRWEFRFTSRIFSQLRSYCKYDIKIGNEAVVKGLFLSHIISTKLPFFDPFGCYMDILLGSKVNTSLASRVTDGIRILLIWGKLASLQLRTFVKGLKNESKIFKYHMKGARVKWSFNQQLSVRGNKEELKSLIGKISEHPIGFVYKVMKMVSFMWWILGRHENVSLTIGTQQNFIRHSDGTLLVWYIGGVWIMKIRNWVEILINAMQLLSGPMEIITKDLEIGICNESCDTSVAMLQQLYFADLVSRLDDAQDFVKFGFDTFD